MHGCRKLGSHIREGKKRRGGCAALRRLEAESRAALCTQLFIETPYRNAALLATIVNTLAPATRLCVAADLTLPTESVATREVREWRRVDAQRYAKRPAIFVLSA